MRAIFICVAAVVAMPVLSIASGGGGDGDDATPLADGIMALDPPIGGGCFAVRISVESDQAIEGVRWYANEAEGFARLLIGSGAEDLPPVYAEAVSVAQDVFIGEEGWTEIEFSEPVASETEALYVIFEYPEGIPPDSSGPGIGYELTDQTYIVYMSSDGDHWIKLAADYQLLVDPIVTGRDGSVIALRGPNIGSDTPQIRAPSLRIYPNPFNPAVEIQLRNVTDRDICVDVYDLSGARVRQLYRGRTSESELLLTWDGRDDQGRRQSSGMYLFKASGEGVSLLARAVMLK